MKQSIITNHRIQSGVALVLSLLLLLVMTVLGVSAMSSVNMQERMAGNASLQALAFETASGGVANTLKFVSDEANWGVDANGQKRCGDFEHGGWDGPTEWTLVDSTGATSLLQRMYCLAGDQDIRSQLFVLSRGMVNAGGVAASVRDIEVRVDRHRNLIPTCAICPIGTVNEFTAANSKDLKVDGACGPAITASTADDAATVVNAIRENRIGNYIGGITHGELGSPFNDPNLLEQFVGHVKDGMQLHENFAKVGEDYVFDSGDHGWRWYEGDFTSDTDNDIAGNTKFGTESNPSNPAITYFDGNLEAGGGVTGAGILIVNGNLKWHGTPGFQGLILVLGGTMTIEGGGQGANPGGSAVITNLLKPDNNPVFGGVKFHWSGGGDQLYRYSCDALLAARDMLGFYSVEAQDLWELECDCGDLNPFLDDFIIASWRENIGWRDEFFGTGN